MTGDFLSKFKQEGWEIGCLCIMQTIVMRMITQNEVTVSVRPLAFDSSFSDSRCIQDFVGDITAFCLDIKQEFFI